MYYFYYCVVYRRVAQSAHTHPVVSEAEQALKIYRVEKSAAVVEQIIEVGTVDCRYCMLTIPGLHLGCSPAGLR